MIRAAGLGIAMLNAPDSVKAAADVITTYDNNHDGLAEFLTI
jgi:hydroxymethylpyrimidine pyrophosphatase-like HAD family hydrolase